MGGKIGVKIKFPVEALHRHGLLPAAVFGGDGRNFAPCTPDKGDALDPLLAAL